MTSLISNLIFASMIVGIPLYGLWRKIELFESFVSGGRHGFDLIIKITPFIVGMYVAFGMLQASGFIQLLYQFTEPFLSKIGFPAEILPLAIMRPISGSGSIALLTDIIHTQGADSLIAKTAATVLGSTETTIYVIAVYFGSVGVKHYRHALPVGLIADFAGITSSIAICYFLFGN